MPTAQEIQQFYQANQNNPAAIQAAIQQYGITPAQLQAAGLPSNLGSPKPASQPAVNWANATVDQLQAQSAAWTAQGVDMAEQARRAEAAGVNKDTLNSWSAQNQGAGRLAIDNAYSNYGLVQGKDPDGTYNSSTTYVKNGPNTAGALTDAQQLWNASHSGAGSRNEATGGDYSWNDVAKTWDRATPTGGVDIGSGGVYYGPAAQPTGAGAQSGQAGQPQGAVGSSLVGSNGSSQTAPVYGSGPLTQVGNSGANPYQHIYRADQQGPWMNFHSDGQPSAPPLEFHAQPASSRYASGEVAQPQDQPGALTRAGV